MTLVVKGLKGYYGSSQALFGVDLTVQAGTVVTLLGRNGMGKTTLVSSIMGLIPSKSGFIAFEGRDISTRPSYEIAKLGLGLVPEGRRIFAGLTVKENLVATASNPRRMPQPWTIERVLKLFPNLENRMGNAGWQLSGGEQQMLAIARALMTNPRLLILDEATEGLAPLIREEIWRCIVKLKALGQSILLIDKNIEKLVAIADRHVVLEKGRVAWEGGQADFLRDRDVVQGYLGV